MTENTTTSRRNNPCLVPYCGGELTHNPTPDTWTCDTGTHPAATQDGNLRTETSPPGSPVSHQR